MSVNKVILLGNLGKDPIVRKLDNGRAVARFSIATSEKYKDKTGNQVTNTEWHNIVAWTPFAEIAEKFLRKGSQVYLEGKISTNEYTDKEGVSRRGTEITVREMSLVGGSQASSGSNDSYQSEPEYASGNSRSNDIPDDIASSGADDDLPF